MGSQPASSYTGKLMLMQITKLNNTSNHSLETQSNNNTK